MSDPSETVDNGVVRLRRRGHAYAQICRELGLVRAADAQQVFRRAMRRPPTSGPQQVRYQELSRLHSLTERIRADTSKNDIEEARQLKTIERRLGQVDHDG